MGERQCGTAWLGAVRFWGAETEPAAMRQGACLSWTELVVWYPAGIPQAGTLEISWTVPARVFGSTCSGRTQRWEQRYRPGSLAYVRRNPVSIVR